MAPITTRFTFARHGHSVSIFYQPLYYVAMNARHTIVKKNNLDKINVLDNEKDNEKDNKKDNEIKLIDKKLLLSLENLTLEIGPTINLDTIDLEDSNNMSSASINLNFILDRYNTDYKFSYDGAQFNIKSEAISNSETSSKSKIEQHPISVSHSEQTISSSYEIIYDSSDINKFESFIKSSIVYYNRMLDGMKNNKDKITIYISSSEGDYFNYLGVRNQRSLNTIYLPAKQKQSIIDDLTRFIKPETKIRYQKLGINYKRVYLLEGVPGAGKSSFIMALASKFGYNIAIISFTPKMTDVNLIRALRSLDEIEDDNKHNKNSSSSVIKKKFFIVFEDMDCIFKERKSNDEGKNMVTFSGILNALDGITTNDNLICFITTNYKNNLDSALIRPGRVDYIMKFDYAVKEQILDIFKVYTCEKNEPLDSLDSLDSLESLESVTKSIDKFALEFYDKITDLNIKISTSLLQQYLLKYLDMPEEAIKNIDELKKMYESSKVASFEEPERGLYN